MSLTESATFNDTSSYYVSKTGSSVAGVLSLQGLSGVVALASSDSSITATASPGVIQLTTTGNALAPSTLTASGAVSGASVSTVGAVSAGTINATGSVNGASVSATGAIAGATVSGTTSVSGAIVSASSQLVSLGQSLPSLLPRGYQSLSGTITFTSPTNKVNIAEIGINATSLPSIAISGSPILIMMTMSPASRTAWGGGGAGVPMSLNTQWVYPQNDGSFSVVAMNGMTAIGGAGTNSYLQVENAVAPNSTIQNYIISANLASASLYGVAINWNIIILNSLPNVAY